MSDFQTIHPKAAAGTPGGIGGQFVPNDSARQEAGQISLGPVAEYETSVEGINGTEIVRGRRSWQMPDGTTTTVTLDIRTTARPSKEFTFGGKRFGRDDDIDQEALNDINEELRVAYTALNRSLTIEDKAGARSAQERLDAIPPIDFVTTSTTVATNTALPGEDSWVASNRCDSQGDAMEVTERICRVFDDPSASLREVHAPHRSDGPWGDIATGPAGDDLADIPVVGNVYTKDGKTAFVQAAVFTAGEIGHDGELSADEVLEAEKAGKNVRYWSVVMDPSAEDGMFSGGMGNHSSLAEAQAEARKLLS